MLLDLDHTHSPLPYCLQVIETRHNDNSDEAPFIMVQSQIPMMQFPFHVVRQSQQTEELYPVGQPKHP